MMIVPHQAVSDNRRSREVSKMQPYWASSRDQLVVSKVPQRKSSVILKTKTLWVCLPEKTNIGSVFEDAKRTPIRTGVAQSTVFCLTGRQFRLSIHSFSVLSVRSF